MNEGDLQGKTAANLAKYKQNLYRRVQLEHYRNDKISSIAP